MLKRMTLLLMVAIALLWGVGGVLADDSVIFQTSFELSDYDGVDEHTERPPGWNHIIMSPEAEHVTIEWDQTVGKTGNASLKQTQSTEDSNSAWFYVIEGVEGGEIYTFSAWIRSSGTGSGGAGFWIEWKDAEGELLRNDIPIELINTDDEWQHWTLALIAPRHTGQVTFILRHNNLEGTTWYDDLVVYRGFEGFIGEMTRADE